MNRYGLYSKAAKIIRSLPQERGTAEQMIAAAKKAGAKPAEFEGDLPTGKIGREELARHFDQKIPKMFVEQYGDNPGYMKRGESRRFMDLQDKARSEGLTPDEQYELNVMMQKTFASPSVVSGEYEDEEFAPTNYDEYKLHGGNFYRERLIKGAKGNGPTYQSSHWSDHPNVIAHIRMQDRTVGEDRDSIRPIMERLAKMAGVDSLRDLGSGAVHVGLRNGVITPEEAASVSRVMHWYTGHESKPGIGKRLLHVEELQSDWAQQGRDQGFNDGSAKKAYFDHIEDMRNRMRQSLLDQGMPENVARPLYEKAEAHHLAKFHGEEDKLNALRDAVIDQQGKVPTGPYVTNTQHWTDLALKNVLREAALGDYDGIVFTPGQAQADRYNLQNSVSKIMLHRHPQDNQLGRLVAYDHSGEIVHDEPVEDEGELRSLIGAEASQRMLAQEPTYDLNKTAYRTLEGDDLKLGGHGMKGYYDNIVPKSVMKLAQMHDPDIKPAEPVPLQGDDGSYQGFHLPMTDALKKGILTEGFPAYRRGGSVGDALAVTRSFTKDGAGAMMRLNGKGA